MRKCTTKSQKGQQQVPILKKTTRLCPSRCDYSMNCSMQFYLFFHQLLKRATLLIQHQHLQIIQIIDLLPDSGKFCYFERK